ncbi:AAA family ATPase [Acinetobacter baumannii]|uniref:AAA family ATPase n=1 Tax=Acinetobacter baumannii TaxID=470 RepID=UPI000DE6D9DD|nr:AAA family ATPase [Acinetobacter baumannii]MDC4314941.1 AAA family ATPase [Acinetobacter baumannii]MDH2543328.1 AAA family ATPase [Acinetobacter baumannii]MDN8430359.1 AAA family ATPase [Acinetobacter baumannii]MDV4266375.1 AAA family ATPase [Acinetobacter baumannii]SSR41629.1 cytochrome c biogenesis protein CcmA [Acinetobacter baumannii]
MLRKIIITGLFNRFNYEINFEFEKNNNLLLLTAPNGFGKSTILRIINLFFNKNFKELEKIKFEKIIFFINDNEIIVRKITDGRFRTLDFTDNKNNHFIYDVKSRELRRKREIIENSFPFLERISLHHWIDKRSNNVLTHAQVENEYGSILIDYEQQNSYIETGKDEWLNKIISSIVVDFISTERLLDQQGNNRLAVTQMASTISDMIKNNIRQQFVISKRQESSFPQRVMRMLEEDRYVGVNEIVEKINKLQKFNETYNKNEIFGPINLEQDVIEKLYSEEISQNKSFLLVLHEYISDAFNKTKKFEDLAKKLDLFTKSINDLFIFKKIEITSDGGIVVTNNEGSTISLDSLSSGEQHLLIMIGKLVFESHKNTLVLLDEPEISLHPAWQEEILKIFESIKKINNLNILIATHSPSLIGENWDAVIELAELTEGKL